MSNTPQPTTDPIEAIRERVNNRRKSDGSYMGNFAAMCKAPLYADITTLFAEIDRLRGEVLRLTAENGTYIETISWLSEESGVGSNIPAELWRMGDSLLSAVTYEEVEE